MRRFKQAIVYTVHQYLKNFNFIVEVFFTKIVGKNYVCKAVRKKLEKHTNYLEHK